MEEEGHLGLEESMEGHMSVCRQDDVEVGSRKRARVRTRRTGMDIAGVGKGKKAYKNTDLDWDIVGLEDYCYYDLK